jgi:3-dehydroquinate dehydratase type I
MRQRKRPLRLDRANVVGVIISAAGLASARRLAERGLDAVEVRLDLLGSVPRVETLVALPIPIIATVRSEREGGAAGLDDARRVELYRGVLGVAKAIDLELASLPAMESVARAARAAKARVILSVHDFDGAPSRRALRTLAERAADAGADVFKVAFTPSRLSQLSPVIELLEESPLPVAAMAMGRYGKVSRLLFAAGGSVLNYGWIERSVVPGQWSAAELRTRMDEIGGR